MKLQLLIQKVRALIGMNDHQNKEKKKILDDNGKPIIWYKGMRQSRCNETGIMDIDSGVFFCNNEYVAKSYDVNLGFVLRAHILVSDPFIIDAKGKGYEYIPWDCNPSDVKEFKRFKHKMGEYYPVDEPSTNRFSSDQIARFIREETSHDAVIIHNMHEPGIHNNYNIIDICVWDNACIEVIS